MATLREALPAAIKIALAFDKLPQYDLEGLRFTLTKRDQVLRAAHLCRGFA